MGMAKSEKMKSLCADCFQENCEFVPIGYDGNPMSWSDIVERSHRMFREHWKEPYKSRYEATTLPPTAALYEIKSNFTGELVGLEAAYAMGMTSEEVYLNNKAYALWGLAYVSLLLNEFEDAQDYHTTFMNVNLAYYNADHKNPEQSIFVFQRTLKSGHRHFCAVKYDLKGQKPCATAFNGYGNIVTNPLRASLFKSLVPLVKKDESDLDREELSDDVIVSATELKKAGNYLFNVKEWKRAKDKYEKALEAIGGLENNDAAVLTSVLWSNLSAVFLNDDHPTKAAAAARNAISSDNTNPKAYVRLSKALCASGDYSSALKTTIDAMKFVDDDWRKVIVAEQKCIQAAIEKKTKKKSCHKKTCQKKSSRKKHLNKTK